MKTIPPAIDQGYIDNCKAQAVGFGHKSRFGLDFDVNQMMVIGTQRGAGINHMLDALLQYGALPVGVNSIEPTITELARIWYDQKRYALEYISAKYRIKEYKTISTEPELLATIADDSWYVVFTVGVPRSYNPQVSSDGIFRPHLAMDANRGTHAMSAWHINPDGTIRVLNSWGTGWGDNGQANMIPEDMLRVDHCFAYRFDASAPQPEQPKENPIKEEKEVRYTAFIKTVSPGASVKVRETSAADSTQIGSIIDGSLALVLGESGTRKEVCFSKSTQEYLVGWIPASYLIDKLPDKPTTPDTPDPEPFTPVDKGVFTYTESQKDLRLTEHFTVGDFWAYDGHKQIKLDTTLAYILEKFYTNFAAKPLLRNKNLGTSKAYSPSSTAGYRDSLNWTGSKTSQHCYGKGLDFYIPGIPAYKLAQFAETIPEVGGIGLYLAKSGELKTVKHIHIDTRSGSRARWGWNGQTSGTNTPGFGGIKCTFRKGNKSAAIEEIQTTLNTQGYKCGTPDGHWGDSTDKAFKAWQKAKGLKADGIYGVDSNKIMGLFGW